MYPRTTEKRLIVVEGIDRAGKSTLVRRLPGKLPSDVTVVTTGEFRSPITKVLRCMLKKGSSPWLKTFMFAADRAWTLEHCAWPALLRPNAVVVWDRYVASALAYRAAELSTVPASSTTVDINFVRSINSLFPAPGLTLFVEIPVATSMERARHSGKPEIYGYSTLERVCEEYERLSQEPNGRFVKIDGTRAPDEVLDCAVGAISNYLSELPI